MDIVDSVDRFEALFDFHGQIRHFLTEFDKKLIHSFQRKIHSPPPEVSGSLTVEMWITKSRGGFLRFYTRLRRP